MKKFFAAIRKGDLDTVKALLEKKPELVASIAAASPKSDAGQAPLQVAIRNGKFEIAELLLDCGADVNFMEAEDCENPWRAPALHDAVRAAVFSCRTNNVYPDGDIVVLNSQEKADAAFHILKRLIELGADVNAVDSFGNSCMVRAALDAKQVLPASKEDATRIFTPELQQDVARIFDLLVKSGAPVPGKTD